MVRLILQEIQNIFIKTNLTKILVKFHKIYPRSWQDLQPGKKSMDGCLEDLFLQVQDMGQLRMYLGTKLAVTLTL